ncbi:hypothetical protein P8C59_007423 [Phyllachora maydis]|uniref:Uncharacterized protein n=1 Tax=Phyllachora maydis TaxID=1825666 RepID=A0AAD9IA68_9PEZI|nr:hypothetical protein P8C59_007423 [Phyllachora maydis]
MSSYDAHDAPVRERSTRKVYREVRQDDRDPRYAEPRDKYLSTHSRDLVSSRVREDSDLSVEDIHRDFPPPGFRDTRRARSAEPGTYDDDYYDRRSRYTRSDREYARGYDRGSHRYDDRDYDYPPRKYNSVYYDDEERKRARMLGKQEQIIAAVTGAALAIGGKELYDRREAHGGEVNRNLLTTAALGAAGAFAGYSGTEAWNKHKQKEDKRSTYTVHKGRDGKISEYYSDDEEDSKEKRGHKNFLESALAAAGLGNAVKALTGGGSHNDDKSDTRSDTRSRRGSRERSRSRGSGEGANKIQKAAMASLIAGATEAFRIAKEPGGWKGEKAKRVLTVAAGAATIDAAQNSDKAGSKLGIAESVIGGLLGNRLVNGSKKNIEEDVKTGRSRSRSRAPSKSRSSGGGGGLAALATAGLGAVAGKKLLDNRSRSRARSSDSEYDSHDGSPRRHRRSRSRSVVDTARRSLARLGIGSGPDDERDDHSRDWDDSDDGRRGSRRSRKYDDDDYDDYDAHSRRGGRDDYDDDRSVRGGGRDREGDRSRNKAGGSKRGDASDSDLGNSDEDEKRAKKMRGKQILTSGLAAVATIHAAHNVYQSMEKRHARHKAVKEGRLSPEEAKKLKTKALLQDAASVGIAALGIKGAVSEMKEAREVSHECKEWQEKRAERHQRRLERLKRVNSYRGDGSDESDDENSSYYGRRRADNWSSSIPSRATRYDKGPHYSDANPYAALPAPPVGYDDRA